MSLVKETGYMIKMPDGTLEGRVRHQYGDHGWSPYKTRRGAERRLDDELPQGDVIRISLTIEEIPESVKEEEEDEKQK